MLYWFKYWPYQGILATEIYIEFLEGKCKLAGTKKNEKKEEDQQCEKKPNTSPPSVPLFQQKSIFFAEIIFPLPQICCSSPGNLS